MDLIKNNKYILIVVVLVVFYLAFPYLDRITLYNLDKETILVDALIVEQAGEQYCLENTCDNTMDLTYDMLKDLLVDLSSEDYYDFTKDDGVIVKKVGSRYMVYLENASTGGFEFNKGMVPSIDGLNQVVEDLD